MVPTPFHPIISRWFTDTLGEPTAAQRRGWESIRAGRHTLIAAPTGSGKTLAAFLSAIDDLVQEGLRAPLPDEVRVVYVSPLKALSADIHKNLAEPRRGIRELAESLGLEAPRITAAVRTGDTTQSERAAMLRTPPHVLVTTPESLYLLLTSQRSRDMLRTVRTVIVDEIHAVIGTRRGAHLALSLERLQEVAERPIQRLGLSATQKPVEAVAKFLTGTTGSGCAIVDEGHRRAMDLAIEMPRSDLDAVMAHEVWEEYYDRLTALVGEHRTTLVFVNTRKMAERLARHLTERLGSDAVTAHHGSLSKETRLDAERRLKHGQLKALVATASLELGIDIGHVDLVCQIGSPHRIATLLQRVGRSGHTIAGMPKGRLLPVSRDDLVECAALLRAVRGSELDRVVEYDAPLDVLAQQIVAEVSCREYAEGALLDVVRRAWPYRSLSGSEFEAVVRMVSEGYATRRGRRAALVHRDEVHRVLRGRRGSRLLALTSGGAIPEVADYRVVLEPQETFIGTLNEDFAIESNAGDVFQLGNASWRVSQVLAGVVRVTDAQGAPPNLPFWLGEAPARSDELSRAVSDLRADLERVLEGPTQVGPHDRFSNGPTEGDPHDRFSDGSTDVDPHDRLSDGSTDVGPHDRLSDGPTEVGPHDRLSDKLAKIRTHTGPDVGAGFSRRDPAIDWLESETGIGPAAAEQVVEYVRAGRAALGVVPTQETLVLERFFDEAGGMQLVLHAPFGSRINRAWALALRKRFCRQFNFELQAAATEDALLLSLGPQHSFPLADVFRYLHPSSARDILVQAFLDAPVFQTRWRWNATISLAVPRNRSGRKVPPQLQRMQADDLMAAVFPDAAACLENIPGDREIPDHPLVNQTVRDCLDEAMDFEGLSAVLDRIHRGELRLLARDTPEPSAFAHEVLNARPYAFLDDAPLEERRTQAVHTRRASDPGAGDIGALDAASIQRVRDEERPDPRDADELHDALVTNGFLLASEVDPACATALAAAGRATRLECDPEAARTAEAGREEEPARPAEDCELLRRSMPSADAVSGSFRIPAIVHRPGAAPDSSARGAQQRVCVWVAAERLPEHLAVHPAAILDPVIAAPATRGERTWARHEALIELLRGRLAITGPTTARALGDSLGVVEADAHEALLALEADGAVLRGVFTPGARALEWCDRRLLARIHRYTMSRLRAEISPVSAADFMRFLFAWQHVAPAAACTGIEGLRVILAQLDGLELPATAWERDVLPARLDRYEPAMLDLLCLTGDVGWARLSSGPTQVVGATPIALFLREHADAWMALREPMSHAWAGNRNVTAGNPSVTAGNRSVSAGNPGVGVAELNVGAGFSRPHSSRVLEQLTTTGASFGHELMAACGLTHDAFRAAIGELVAAGLAASDGFAGLRAIVGTSPAHAPARLNRADAAGRWSALRGAAAAARDESVERLAWTLLHRYGVVFRRLLTREAACVPWRELARVYRRLEARGEIRGGRFVGGMPGEQFALPEAVERLRHVRREPPDHRLITISTADPLNLTGIVTPGDRLRAVSGNRVVYRDGVPVAAMEGDMLRMLAAVEPAAAPDVAAAAAGRRVPVVSGFVGRLR